MKSKILLFSLIASCALYAENNVKATKLETTVVTNERYSETPILEAGKNVSVITSKDIEDKGATSISEALSMVPSLMFIDGKFTMRGQVPKMGDKTTIVLLDGVPQNGLDNRVVEYDFIPMDQIEKIEVLPGGGATMYGGNASSGVINIITKKDPNKNVFGRIGVEGGTFDYRKFIGTVGTKVTDKLTSSVTYKVSRKNGYRDYVENDIDYVDIDNNYKLDGGNIGFKYSYNKRNSGSQTTLTKKQLEENRKYNPSQGKKIEDTQDKYVLTFNKNLDENLDFASVFEYRNRKYKCKYPASNKNPSYISRDKKTDSFYTNLHLKYKYGEKSSLIIGGDYANADVKEKAFKPSNKKVSQTKKIKTDYESIGGYVLNKIGYEDFIFTQGLRVEKNKFDEHKDLYKKGKVTHKKPQKDSPTNVDIDLTGTYLIDSDKSVYMNLSRVKRSPNLTEYSRWDEKLAANKDSQRLDTVEIGTKALFNENIYLQLATYYTRGDKEIMYDPAKKDENSFYNFNGKTERIGVEFYSEQYLPSITFRETFTYMHNRVKNGKYNGKDIPGVPNIVAGIGATYEIISNLTFNADMLYTGKAYFANDFKNKFDKVPGITTTDINLRYNFDNGLSVYGGVKNLFDKEYSRYNMISGHWPNSQQKYTPADGRVYNVGFEYKF